MSWMSTQNIYDLSECSLYVFGSDLTKWDHNENYSYGIHMTSFDMVIDADVLNRARPNIASQQDYHVFIQARGDIL